MRRCLASTGVWSLRTKVRHCEPQRGSPTSPGPMLTRETCVSVVRTNRWKWLRHLDQKVRWRREGSPSQTALSPRPPGVEQAAKGPIVSCFGTWEFHKVVSAPEYQPRLQTRKCQRTLWKTEAA